MSEDEFLEHVARARRDLFTACESTTTARELAPDAQRRSILALALGQAADADRRLELLERASGAARRSGS